MFDRDPLFLFSVVSQDPTRTSRNHTGFKKLIQNFFFVNTHMPGIYKEVEKYFAHFAQN